jgi:hypothetical protein
MKYVMLMLLMASNVSLMAQPLGPVIDLQTGQFKGFADQNGRDIVILGPKGMMIIPDALPPPAPRAPAPVNTDPNAPTNSSSTNTAPNPRGK